MTKLRRLPDPAVLARDAALKAMGPLADARRSPSALDTLTHGLRAAGMGGMDRGELEALLPAVRLELGASGPCARHLAETAASCIRRAARAERMERDLEARLERDHANIAEALLADTAARATMALIARWRREADADLRRSLDALKRLHAARLAGLFPSGEQAHAAEQQLDSAFSANEPSNENVEPSEEVALRDEPPVPDGAALLAAYRAQPDEDAGLLFWDGLRPDEQVALNAAAEAEDAGRRGTRVG